MPTVPVPAWEQVAIVIIFAFLLAGLGWVLTRVFSGSIEKNNASHAETIEKLNTSHTQAIREINAHYATLMRESNGQWQKYFDARSEASKLVNNQIVEKLEKLTQIIEMLRADFDQHNQQEFAGEAPSAHKRKAKSTS